MQLITFTERELDALEGEPAEVCKMYLLLRRRMDFQTGLVGADHAISWWGLRRSMQLAEVQGRSREDSDVPTEKMVRDKADRLIRIGLLERRTVARRLVFFLPFAHKAQVRLKKVGQTLGRQAGQTLGGCESLDTQGYDENYPQDVGRTETQEVGHISGIRVNNLSEYKLKQQHRTPVDNFAALPCDEVAIWIRSAERRRGKIVAVSESDPHIKSWVSKGVDAEALEEAHALAVAARDRDASAAPINIGFLNLFVEQVLARRVPWHQSKQGIERKAEVLGIERKPDEQFPYFRLRVFAAAGITEEEARRWRP